MVDRDGVEASISGQPGCWAHACEDEWWPCQRKAAEEHAEIKRLREALAPFALKSKRAVEHTSVKDQTV
ncbi:MAG: hypothetical protein V3U39_12270 [Acidimicrobiia bacterium]